MRAAQARLPRPHLHRHGRRGPGLPGGPADRTRALESLKDLHLNSNQITDAGCATLASALRGGALPALKQLLLGDNPAISQQAKAEVRAALEARAE